MSEPISKEELAGFISDLKRDLTDAFRRESGNIQMRVATELTKMGGKIDAARGEVISLRGEFVTFKGEQTAHNAVVEGMLSDAIQRLDELGEKFEAASQILTGLRSQSESTFRKVFKIDEIVEKTARVTQETFDAVNPDDVASKPAKPSAAPGSSG